MEVSKLAVFQVILVLVCSLGVYQTSIQESESSTGTGDIVVIDSNDIEHHFDESPSRVALTNTYAASVMRMLDVDMGKVVGISGDFSDELLWPEFVNTPLVQQSAHSEIDFESLLDSRPEVYIVFATNGMVDTNAIREKLEPVGIKVVALDFYKYDSLRDEINVIATLFEKQQQALDLFAEFDMIENMVSERIMNMNESTRPQIVMEHHASLTRDPVVLTGTSQWTDMIEKAGGRNVFADLPGHTTHVDMEAIMDENPDIIMFDGITFEIGFNNYDDGIYSYLLRGMMEGYFIEGEKLEIEVNYIPPKPILALDTQLINEGDSITISWSHIEGAEWYEIIIQDEEGNIQQMYNGSDNQVTLDGLSIGQNRIRANGMINGKVSDYSSSVFVTVLENEESSFPIGTLIFGFMLIALFTSNYILRENKNRRGE